MSTPDYDRVLISETNNIVTFRRYLWVFDWNILINDVIDEYEFNLKIADSYATN